MQSSDLPLRLETPFANASGTRTDPIPTAANPTPGGASLDEGFPPLTRQPISSGGIPPSGNDMNGILFEMSAIDRWANAGGGYPFDQDYADAIGGYPKGAVLLRSDGLGYWMSIVEDNDTDPNDSGVSVGWVPGDTYGASAITMTNANVTLTALQWGKPIILITGVLAANLNLIFPNLVKSWIVINATTGAFTITAKTSAGTGPLVGSVTEIVGDGTNIKSVSQGASADVTFSAGNFTANGAQTWTVAIGDQQGYYYVLNGKMMTLFFYIVTTTVGGTPDTTLRIAIPASKVVAKYATNSCSIVDNGTPAAGIATVSPTDTKVNITKQDGTNFSAATDATSVTGQITFEVTQ